MGSSTTNARLAFGGLLLLGLGDLGLVNLKLAPELAEEQAKEAAGKQPEVKTTPTGPGPSATTRSSVAVAPPVPTPEPPKTAVPEPTAPPSASSTVAAVDTAPPTPTVEPPPVKQPDPPAVASGDKPGTISDVMFELDSNLLTLTAKGTLDDVVKKLKGDSSLRIHVRGHSDQLGSREHNLELSRRRAASVENFLLGNGVPRSRITTEAVGGMKPADPSNTPAAWARNRRVELEWR
jgi:outer membrane protein OmpA-like peptidoglycan-associated protein